MLNLNNKTLILTRERTFIPQPAYKPHFPTHPSIVKQPFSTIQKVKINRKDVISHCRYQSTFSSPKGLRKQENMGSPHNYKTPKISFSYNRKRQHNEETNSKYLPGSCRQIFKDHPGEIFPIQQFSIAAKKPAKQDKREKLRIYQCISHVISTPQSHTHITETDNNVLPFLPNISENGKNSSLSSQCSDHNGEKNGSKVVSTQANSSTFGGSRHDLPHQAQHNRPSKGFLFDLSQSKQQKPKLTLLDRVSPSKLLKKTIILSKYDFGGMLKENYKSQNQNPQQDHSPTLKFSSTSANQKSSNVQINISTYRQANKWQNCVKCLFSDNDLKESIHCGPDLPSSQPNNFLLGFGRQVEASCIPEQQ